LELGIGFWKNGKVLLSIGPTSYAGWAGDQLLHWAVDMAWVHAWPKVAYAVLVLWLRRVAHYGPYSFGMFCLAKQSIVECSLD
jgi:hypothetical protein